MWAKASSPRVAQQPGESAAGPRSGSSTYPQAGGRQAVLGGPRIGILDQLAPAGVAGQAARPMKDGKGVVGIVMDAHLGPDEVGTQRAGRQLQHEAAVAHGVVVADDARFLDR